MSAKSFGGHIAVAVIILFFVVIIANSVIYVPQDMYVCVKRFEEVTATYTEPGLKFKIPFIETTVTVPKHSMIYILNPSETLTKDRKSMIVSSYVVWKVTDPLKFLQNAVTSGNAESRIDLNVYNAIKNKISSMDQEESIKVRGNDLNKDIIASVNEAEAIKGYGIVILDVQIKQFDLPADNKQAVYQRMISERNQIAAQFRAEGRSEAEMIRNEANRERTVLLAEARSDAERTKAEGESEYMKILAEAYSGAERAEFYEFIRSMDALKIAMQGRKTLLLPLDSPLAKWFVVK